jgi:hypothetical protein
MSTTGFLLYMAISYVVIVYPWWEQEDDQES